MSPLLISNKAFHCIITLSGQQQCFYGMLLFKYYINKEVGSNILLIQQGLICILVSDIFERLNWRTAKYQLKPGYQLKNLMPARNISCRPYISIGSAYVNGNISKDVQMLLLPHLVHLGISAQLKIWQVSACKMGHKVAL